MVSVTLHLVIAHILLRVRKGKFMVGVIRKETRRETAGEVLSKRLYVHPLVSVTVSLLTTHVLRHVTSIWVLSFRESSIRKL